MDAILGDKKFLIHVFVEIVLIACVAFWLHSKISAKDEVIARLEKENVVLKARLDRIENYLAQLSGQPPPHPPQAPPSAEQPHEEAATKRSGTVPKKGKKKDSPTASKDEEFNKSSDDEEIEI
uniref:Uncharacterized protein n=1 Tax=viral metagenome TaxID=1070528 RepID=A0A6C0JSZ0_9ZZZZ